jgi:hypothetical protein
MNNIEKLIKDSTCNIICLITLWGLINNYDNSHDSYYLKIITLSLTGYIILTYNK